jgi:hypothetical protein
MNKFEYLQAKGVEDAVKTVSSNHYGLVWS